ncbi:MAG: hypothetical protein LBU21_09025, partial [Treponema sp.]|nr:hypothetical protein [Treponema sp.]
MEPFKTARVLDRLREEGFMGEMNVQSQGSFGGGGFEEVWAILQDNARQLKETDRLIRNLSAESRQRQKEIDR